MKLTEETKFPVAVMLILTLLLTVTLLFVPFPVRGATLHHVQVDLGRGSELPQARRDEIELATH